MGRDSCYNLFFRSTLATKLEEKEADTKSHLSDEGDKTTHAGFIGGAMLLAEWIHDGYTKVHHPQGASKGILDALSTENWPMLSKTDLK